MCDVPNNILVSNLPATQEKSWLVKEKWLLGDYKDTTLLTNNTHRLG